MRQLVKRVLATAVVATALIFTGCQKGGIIEEGAAFGGPSRPKGDGSIVERPFSDYLKSQGKSDVVDTLYVEPVPNFFGWGEQVGDGPDVRWVSADYNGTSAQYLKLNGGPVIPTTVTGTLTEEKVSDGRVIVTVILHAENALTFALTSSENPPNLLGADLDFGHRPHELLANPALHYATGTVDFTFKFYNRKPGIRIPDLTELNLTRGEDIISYEFHSTSTGVFHGGASGIPDGAHGTITNYQKGAAPWSPDLIEDEIVYKQD